MVNRNVAPHFVKPEFFPLTEANSTILAGGVNLHIVNSGDTELLRLEIIFKAGKWYQQKKGQAVLTSKMLLEGTKSFNSENISQIFETNGAFFEISCGMDFVNFTVYCINRNLTKLLPVIFEIINEPTFPEKEFLLAKDIQIQNLKVNLKKNNFLTSRIFKRNLFGGIHPYGTAIEINDIEALTKTDLQDYYKQFIQNDFEVVVAGKLNSEDEGNLISFFQQFRTNEVLFKRDNTSVTLSNPQYLEIDDSLQTSIKIGSKVFHKSDPRYFHLLIFNEILGGYFGSRLMQKIREEKGYSYGIHSAINQNIHDAYFFISTEVIKKHKNDAIKSIYGEIENLIYNRVSQEEFNTVVNYFKGSFLSSINSPFALADKFKNLYFNNLTYNYYQSLFEELDAMSPDSLHAFANDYFSNLKFTEVSVG